MRRAIATTRPIPKIGTRDVVIYLGFTIVEINMTPAVLHEIQQRAHKENVSLGQSYYDFGEACDQIRLDRVALGRGQ